MYSIVRKLLFLIQAEYSHNLALAALNAVERLQLISLFCGDVKQGPIEVMGLSFSNRVGLAAGLDKNGDYYNALGQMGFGHIEIGTVTPRAQPGNARPRMFRLAEQQAIINRMGFNNKGVQHLVEQVKSRRYKGVLGINVGKNKDTPEEKALVDYELCMDAVYPHADYISINVSSPNTPGLRNLQFGAAFEELLAGVKRKQAQLAEKFCKHVPLAVKIAPDIDEQALALIADILLHHKLEAVIATNTTVGREGVENSAYREEAGGLSGMPLKDKSTEVIRQLATRLDGRIPIIGVGGIIRAEDALEKIEAGASLVQIYSGFIYRGPALVRECARLLSVKSPE